MKQTVYVFRENVAALLKARHEDGASLAFWCRHDKSWMSKILTGERVVSLRDIDAIADFFGLSPYQLFQPGISPMTERRVAERRSGRDRRGARREPENHTFVRAFQREQTDPDPRVRMEGSRKKGKRRAE